MNAVCPKCQAMRLVVSSEMTRTPGGGGYVEWTCPVCSHRVQWSPFKDQGLKRPVRVTIKKVKR